MLLVSCGHTLGNLNGNTDAFFDFQLSLLCNVTFQGNAFNQLHHNIVKLSLINNIIYTDNIGVRKSCSRLSLHFEFADKIHVVAEFFF